MYLEYVDKPSDEIGQYMIAHHQDFPASVQEEINRRIKELMENHVGFVLCGLLPYDAEDCRVTKESAINLGWDKNGQYTVAFKFIDARVAGDVSAYLDLLERDFHKLMVLHQELLLFQLGNIIQPETDAEKERLIKILRNWLPEMSPRQISFVAPALMDLEGKGH